LTGKGCLFYFGGGFMRRGKSTWLAICFVVLLVLSYLGVSYAADAIQINANDYLDVELDAPPHTCAWLYEDYGDIHRMVCGICGKVKPGSEAAHTFIGDGNKWMCTDYTGGEAYKSVCSLCGHTDGIRLLIHGRVENYPSTDAVYAHRDMARALKNISRITYAEFKSTYRGYSGYNLTFGIPGSNKTSFADSDLGYVFTGGPVIEGGGRVGTLQLYGRGSVGESQSIRELNAIAAYLGTLSNKSQASKSGLISFLSNRLPNENAAGVPGMRAAFSSMSAGNFQNIINSFYKPDGSLAVSFMTYNYGQYHGLTDIRPAGVGANNWGSFYTTTDTCYTTYAGGGQVVSTTSMESRTCYLCKQTIDGFIGLQNSWPTFSGMRYWGRNDVGKTSKWYINSVSIKDKGTVQVVGDVTLTALTQNNFTCRISNVHLEGDSAAIPYVTILNPPGTFEISGPTNKTLNEGDATPNAPAGYVGCGTLSIQFTTNGRTLNRGIYWRIGKPYAGMGYTAIAPKDKPATLPSYQTSGWFFYGDSYGTQPGTVCMVGSRWYKDAGTTLNFEDELTIHYRVKGESSELGTRRLSLKGKSGTQSYWEIVASLELEVYHGYLQTWVTDSLGNSSGIVEIYINNIDSREPQSTYNPKQTNWAQYRNIEVTMQDLNKVMWGGLSTTKNWLDMSYSGIYYVPSRGLSVANYVFRGDVDTPEDISFFKKDQAGNTGTMYISLTHLDNTKPKVTSVRKVANSLSYDKFSVQVQATDYADRVYKGANVKGSGYYNAMKYMVTTTDTAPSTTASGWKTGSVSDGLGTCQLDIPTSGIYYIWVMDTVGWISDPWKLEVTLHGEKASLSGYDILDKPSGSSDSYNAGGSPKYNTGYNFHPFGFVFETGKSGGYFLDSESTSSKTTSVDIYYKRVRYTLHFTNEIGTSGTMPDQTVVWGTQTTLDPNQFKKEYWYNIHPNNGDCSVSQLHEVWTFNGWQYKGSAAEGWWKNDRKLADKETFTLTNDLNVRDGQTIELKATWTPNPIELPQISQDGADFIGWFSVEQNYDNASNSGLTSYRVGNVGEMVVLEGHRRGYYAQRSDNTYDLWAWWNFRPVFADIYEGLFFEGQYVDYNDLLELIKVFDYEKDYQKMAQSAVDAYFDEADLIIDNKLNDLESKRYEMDSDEDNERLEKQIEALYTKADFVGQMREYVTNEVNSHFLQPHVVKLEYYREGEESSSTVTDHHGTSDSENKKDDGNYFKLIDSAATTPNFRNTHRLDTSSTKVGDVKVTYQVTDLGISVKGIIKDIQKGNAGEFDSVNVKDVLPGGANGVIPGTRITMEYTRDCQVNFNYNPMIKPMTLQWFTNDNLGSSLTAKVLEAQYAYDPEDSQSNAPWWTHKASYADIGKADTVPARLRDQHLNTKANLQSNMHITGIERIRMNGTFMFRFREVYDKVIHDFESPEGTNHALAVSQDGIIVKDKVLDALYAFKGDKTVYAICKDRISKKWYSITKDDIWSMLESMELIIDTRDQWGKWASNRVSPTALSVDTSKAPMGYKEKYLGIKKENGSDAANGVLPGQDYDVHVYQKSPQRTATLMLIYGRPEPEMCECGCGELLEDCTCPDCPYKKCPCGCGHTLQDCTCEICQYKKCPCGCGELLEDCTCDTCPYKKCPCGCGKLLKDCDCPTCKYKLCPCGCGEILKDCKCEDCPYKLCSCGCGELASVCDCDHNKPCPCGCGKTLADCTCENCPYKKCPCGCGKLMKDCDCPDCPYKLCECGCGKTEKDCDCEDCPYKKCPCGCGKSEKDCDCTNCPYKKCPCGCGKVLIECDCEDCPYRLCLCGCGHLLSECDCEDCPYKNQLCPCGCGKTLAECDCDDCPWTKLCPCGCGKILAFCDCEDCPWKKPCPCGCGKILIECDCEDCPWKQPCPCGCGDLLINCKCKDCPYKKPCPCGCGKMMYECDCEDCPYKKPCPCGCGELLINCKCKDCPWTRLCECGCGKILAACDCPNCPQKKPCPCGCGKILALCDCQDCPYKNKYCTCGCGKLESECMCRPCPHKPGGSEDNPLDFDPWEDTMDNFGLESTRVNSQVRFIDEGYGSMLGTDYLRSLNNSFWKNGLGSDILSGTFDAESDRQLSAEYSGEYEDNNGNKVPIVVKDYTQ